MANKARESLKRHKREQSLLIKQLLKKHKLSYEEADRLLHVSRVTIAKAAKPNTAESVSLDSLYLILYALEYETWRVF